jgi:hypothetical protein
MQFHSHFRSPREVIHMRHSSVLFCAGVEGGFQTYHG